MGDLTNKTQRYAAAYAVGTYPRAATRANQLGYALSLHGSLQRDLDLIAVPWTDEACSARDLVAAICDEFDVQPNRSIGDPERKPHGRLAWSIPLWWGAYIDLSVIPRQIPDAPEVG